MRLSNLLGFLWIWMHCRLSFFYKVQNKKPLKNRNFWGVKNDSLTRPAMHISQKTQAHKTCKRLVRPQPGGLELCRVTDLFSAAFEGDLGNIGLALVFT